METPAQKAHQENPMNSPHYIGLDVHKKTISYCVKTAAGEIVNEGKIASQREALRQWAESRGQPWRGAMEATLFSSWIYDTLLPYSEHLEMAHPAKMKAISAGKKKSDTIDARTIADLVRCSLLPACYVAPPRIRELRRLLRYRSLVVSEAVRMKNKMAGLLMETGALYVKQKLHRKKYFANRDGWPGLCQGLPPLPRVPRPFDFAQGRLFAGFEGRGFCTHPTRQCFPQPSHCDRCP
jgi:hypothetical protein